MEEIWERDLSPERIAYLAQSRIPGIIACNTILLVFATGGLLVRLFVRVRYLTGINLDDVLCITSWVGSLSSGHRDPLPLITNVTLLEIV